jgi:hypothetical protein
MKWQRPLLLGLASAAWVAAGGCHSKSYSLPTQDAGEDSGGDGGPCQCKVGPDAMIVACGGRGCDAFTLYECATDGMSVQVVGTCGSPMDAASECQPNCDGTRCGDDGCGGQCTCSQGLTCNMLSMRCGNGCTRTYGEPCQPGSMDPQMCCEFGEECDVNDAGFAGCCAAAGGACTQDMDCCGQGTCDTTKGKCT